MDSLIAASARALAAGDALGALRRVALRDDPPALALRGIAMARLGDYPRARELLKRAARAFGSHEALAQARCVVAEAEVALAMRDFAGSPRALDAAAATLHAHGDRGNSFQARLIALRRSLLLGRLEDAAVALEALELDGLSPTLETVAALAATELHLRFLRVATAQRSLARAQAAAFRARIPALLSEVARVREAFERPAARRLVAGGEQALNLVDVAGLLASDALVVDACRRGIGRGAVWCPLARRPVLFALARGLARAWPNDAGREALIADAFGFSAPDDTHRVRLRVEIGRLRALVRPLADVEATPRGFALRPRDGGAVALLAPPIEGEQGALVALLCDGAPWSTSALALALGASQRTVQRALAELEADGRVRAIGHARARRWLAPPLAGFTTILLLPASLPPD